MALNLLARLVSFLRIRKILEAVARRENTLRCRAATRSHESAVFGPTAVIHNRQSRPEAITVGEHALIDGELMVFEDAGRIEIGASSFVGKGSRIWSDHGVVIGKNVFISHNVTISDTNAHALSAAERAADYRARIVEGKPYRRGATETAPVVIEDDAWINFGVAILKGVRIGRGAIIGAGSVVLKDVPPWTFAAGSPAKVIKEIAER